MGLYQVLEKKPVSTLPLRTAPVIDGDQTVRDAIKLMQRTRLGCVFTVDNDSKPTGMFTERMFARLLASGGDHLDARVGDHVINATCTVKLSDPIQTVLHQMQLLDIRFVCVIDEDGRLAGLTGQRGVMEYITDNFSRQIKVTTMDPKLSIDQREGA